MTTYRVRSVMRTDVPILAPDTPIRRAVALLVASRAAGAAVVSDNGALMGILTQKDCFTPALHASYHREWTGRVADHMTHRVATLEAEDDVIHAAETFAALPHRVFPVLDDGAVAGILERGDVLALLSRNS